MKIIDIIGLDSKSQQRLMPKIIDLIRCVNRVDFASEMSRWLCLKSLNNPKNRDLAQVEVDLLEAEITRRGSGDGDSRDPDFDFFIEMAASRPKVIKPSVIICYRYIAKLYDDMKNCDESGGGGEKKRIFGIMESFLQNLIDAGLIEAMSECEHYNLAKEEVGDDGSGSGPGSIMEGWHIEMSRALDQQLMSQSESEHREMADRWYRNIMHMYRGGGMDSRSIMQTFNKVLNLLSKDDKIKTKIIQRNVLFVILTEINIYLSRKSS